MIGLLLPLLFSRHTVLVLDLKSKRPTFLKPSVISQSGINKMCLSVFLNWKNDIFVKELSHLYLRIRLPMKYLIVPWWLQYRLEISFPVLADVCQSNIAMSHLMI